ncbi:DUF899 domain-containing protein [uncultured Roseibium sp.]|uniref:DUF899 domain-containing protein n=1 Tax=uncultured Roseibium sp. TaxID=1936171 RepID=UPI0026234284|nr:DUF899 domain-containing protein [uncultured Roseibium sp.]
MSSPQIVNRDQWLEARKALLAKEKAFTRERDRLSAARRDLPLVLVNEGYVFDTRDGQKSLSDLFGSQKQLVVYHFMFGENWEEGCPSCSFWADNYERLDIHLAARDTALISISSAPLEKLEAYRTRMGWTFDWVSSQGTSFNNDFGVTFPGKEDPAGRGYNYSGQPVGTEELPGVSSFIKLGDGRVAHSYSTYGRGLDILNMAYNLLDLTHLGRHEDDLPYAQAWVKRRDTYGTGD